MGTFNLFALAFNAGIIAYGIYVFYLTLDPRVLAVTAFLGLLSVIALVDVTIKKLEKGDKE